MIRGVAAALALSVMPLLGADIPKGPQQSFQVSTTERFNFLPGGIIRVDNSYGYLSVEGWDEPEVEVTVAKSTDRFGYAEWKQKAEQLFDQVRVVTEQRSDKELTISTILPHRNSLLSSVLPSGRIIITSPVPPRNKRGITVEYRVRVPRDSRLAVHHDNGYVWVSDVKGDIDVHSHTGDMIVMLPDPGPYSIDARTRLGGISSDLPGKTRNQFVVGTHFTRAGEPAPRRVYLRMGRGSITIKAGPASGPFWKN